MIKPMLDGETCSLLKITEQTENPKRKRRNGKRRLKI